MAEGDGDIAKEYWHTFFSVNGRFFVDPSFIALVASITARRASKLCDSDAPVVTGAFSPLLYALPCYARFHSLHSVPRRRSRLPATESRSDNVIFPDNSCFIILPHLFSCCRSDSWKSSLKFSAIYCTVSFLSFGSSTNATLPILTRSFFHC